MTVCSYCGNKAMLVGGEVIYPHRPDLYALRFWQCVPCRAYVGCHRPGIGYGDGTRPLGRLANAELRAAKSRAHAALDPYWREGRLRRTEVYRRLAVFMNMPAGDAHIGEFDVSQCNEVVRLAGNSIIWER